MRSHPNVEQHLAITKHTDVVAAQQLARVMAKACGLPEKDQWEVALAVTEATTNILKHAGQGSLFLRSLEGSPGGVEFEAVDDGPGIGNLEAVLQDDYSEGRDLRLDLFPSARRSLGCGLGAIKRLMDVFDLSSAPGQGTRLRAAKHLRIQARRTDPT